MAKRYRTQKIRIHQTYEVWEVAEVLGATSQTVRKWMANGLSVLNAKRPALILGIELKSYLDTKQAKAKQRMALGECMCMSCRCPRMPYGMMVDYIPMTTTTGRIEALCDECGAVCMRFISHAKLAELATILQITQMPSREPNGTNHSPAKL